jgi:DnaJ-class molecular chaperone
MRERGISSSSPLQEAEVLAELGVAVSHQATCERRSAMTKDYYAILGVPRVGIRRPFTGHFARVRDSNHPDAGAGSSTSKFREALEAYHTLSDPRLRRQHDIDLKPPVAQLNVMPEPLFPPHRSRPTSISPMSSDFNEIFTELFRLIESDFEFRRRISQMFF